MNAHIFQATAGSKSPCSVCGKTRNTKEHKAAKVEQTARVETLDAIDEAADEETDLPEVDDAISEARAEMLPDVSDNTNDSEIADALANFDTRTNEQVESDAAAAEHAQVEHDNKAEAAMRAEEEAPAKKALKAAIGSKKSTASVWVGWRITNAAVLEDSTLATKLKAAKPTADLDRTVRLNIEELQALDAIAASFTSPGHTGPEQYSGRALRGRIAAAIAKIEENKK